MGLTLQLSGSADPQTTLWGISGAEPLMCSESTGLYWGALPDNLGLTCKLATEWFTGPWCICLVEPCSWRLLWEFCNERAIWIWLAACHLCSVWITTCRSPKVCCHTVQACNILQSKQGSSQSSQPHTHTMILWDVLLGCLLPYGDTVTLGITPSYSCRVFLSISCGKFLSWIL